MVVAAFPTSCSRVPTNEQLRHVLQLDDTARTSLGLSSSHPVRIQLAMLANVWQEETFTHLKRHIESLSIVREATHNLGDRIPSRDSYSGDLHLGCAATPTGDVNIQLASDRLCQHMMVCGTPGSGKTVTVRRLLKQLRVSRPDVCIWVFDPNRSYETIGSSSDCLSVSWRDLRFNPLVPPKGVSSKPWRSQVVDIFARGELLHARYLMAKELDVLAELAESREPSVHPSLPQLAARLATKKYPANTASYRYASTLLSVLDGRLRTSGSLYDCSIGMEAGLLRGRIRFDLDGLAPRESVTFLLSYLLHYVYTDYSPPQSHRAAGAAPSCGDRRGAMATPKGVRRATERLGGHPA